MPAVKILTEHEITVRPSLDEEVKQIVCTYQVEGQPPRTVWIDKRHLPDLVYLEEHPEAPQAPEDLVRAGDLVRLRAIWDDQEKAQRRRFARPFSY